MRSPRDRERGQAHTLEAVVGAILLLTAVAFALQVTVVTPLSASTSSQHVEGQERAVAQGVLANAAEEGDLKEAVLYWNETGSRFHGSNERRYIADSPPEGLALGNKLARAFDAKGIAYNVNFVYITTAGELNEQPLIRQGTPSDNAVSATRTVTIRNDDRLVDKDGSLNETTVIEADGFYINNAPSAVTDRGGGHGLYNVVRIEVVAWRI